MSTTAVREFWTWWGSAREGYGAALRAEGGVDVEEITARVRAIHPNLEWHLESGPMLVVSAGGVLGLRPMAEAWVRGAPSGDGWVYRAARPPMAAEWPTLDVQGVPLASREARFGAYEDNSREVLHVEVYHPLFDAMPDELRGAATFQLMDAVLGEDAVMKWVGEIGLADEPPEGALDAAGLRRAVSALEGAATGERWTVGTFDTDEGNFVASVNHAVKALEHLDKPYWAVLRWDLRAGDAALRAAMEAEETALELLGARGVLIGRETGAGRRDLHLHVSDRGGEELRRRARELGAAVEVRPDPSWEVLHRWG